MALYKTTKTIENTTSVHNAIASGEGAVHSVIISTDGANDPTITLYDAATASGTTYLLPPTPFDGATKGLNGITSGNIPFSTGISLRGTGSGTHYVMITYSFRSGL